LTCANVITDVNYLNCFLLTYRTFVTSNELLDLLFMRYQLPPPVNPTPEVMEQFKMKKETPIQLRVLNAFKTWVDKHFDDFREDKQLLARLIDFVDNYMINSPVMQRAGQNFKAQITNKVESKEEKKVPTFNTAPPTPILPTASNPTLLDFNPEEIARQLTLIDYDLYTSIKPIEYLYFNKPSSWALATETQQEDDQDNLKNASHIVAVIYRFTDVLDYLNTIN
jgi:son of sevenless-like protein